MNRQSLRFWICLNLFICLLISGRTYAQEFLPKFDQYKSFRKDSDNYYFKEIWIKSKDISINDPSGYLTRASKKIELGYLKEALSDVNSTIQIDSAIGHSYFLKGFIMLKSDSIKSAESCFKKSIDLKDTNIYNYYYLAEIYANQRIFNKADSLYNIAIRMDDKFVDAYFGLANLYAMRYPFDKAEAYYKKVIKLKPDFSLAYFNMAIMYSFNNHANAIKNLNKTIELTPEFAPAYYVRGHLEKDFNEISATFKDWKKAVELDPDNNMYRVSLGVLNILNRNYETGFYEISKTITGIGSKDLFTYYEQSPIEKRSNDFASQIITFNKYSEQLSKQERGEIINAICFFFLGKFKNAEDIYADMVNSYSAPGLIYYLRGFNLEYLQKADLSIESYGNAVRQKQFPAEAYLRKGIALNFLGRNKDAISTLKLFINNNDSSRLGHRSLASAYINSEKYDSSIFELTKLIKHDSTEFDIWLDRAFCFKKLERFADAIKDCEHILKYKPLNTETISFMAECKYSSGDTLGTYNFLNEIYGRLHFLNEECHVLRGSINLYYTKYDSAIVDFNKVIRFNPEHVEALIYRGLCYYCKEDFVQAKADFTSAIAIRKNDVTALYTRGLINIKLNKLNEAYSDLVKADSFGHPLAKRAILIYLKNFKAPETKK